MLNDVIDFGPISIHPKYQGKGIGKKLIFFMAMELEEGYLANHSGIYDFDKAFNVSDEELEKFE